MIDVDQEQEQQTKMRSADYACSEVMADTDGDVGASSYNNKLTTGYTGGGPGSSMYSLVLASELKKRTKPRKKGRGATAQAGFLPRTCPVIPELRAQIAVCYPGVNACPGHWRLIEYALTSTFFDVDDDGNYTGGIVLPTDMLWKIYPRKRGHQSPAQILALAESEIGLKINADIPVPHRSKREATTIRPEFAQSVFDAWKLNLAARPEERTVYFADGRIVSARRQRAARQAIKQEVADRIAEARAAAQYPETLTVLGFLNEGQPHDYIAGLVRDALAPAKPLAAQMPDGARKDHLERVLLALENGSPTIYKPSGRTRRVFAVGTSINLLPREFRRLILANCHNDGRGRCVELDLSQAQLAINAWLWNLTETTLLLSRARQTGESVWSELLSHAGLGSEHKGIIKTILYSLCYGMGVDKLKQTWMQGERKHGRYVAGVGDEDKWAKFTEHPAIKELLQSRDSILARIRDDEGSPDAFQEWIALHDNGGIDARATLAAIAQSWEQRLMYEMIPVIEQQGQVCVMTWLHDGAALFFRRPDRMDSQISQIREAVEGLANDLGILTALEVDYLDPTDAEESARRYVESQFTDIERSGKDGS